MLQHAGRLGSEAIEILFNAACSAAARKVQSVQRDHRDCAMYGSHVSSQYLNFSAQIARSHFGLKVDLFGLWIPTETGSDDNWVARHHDSHTVRKEDNWSVWDATGKK